MRTVITGIGMVTPVGLDTATSWATLLAGGSGIAEITQFDASDLPIRVAGEVKGFDPSGLVEHKEARRLDRNVLLSIAAGPRPAQPSGRGAVDPASSIVAEESAVRHSRPEC